MITIDGGTGKIMHNGLNVAAAPMVDQWILNNNKTENGDLTDIARSNFTGGGVPIGDGMTQSSGVFTFPTTGKYLIFCAARFSCIGDDNVNCGTSVTLNGGTDFSVVAYASDGQNNSSGGRKDGSNTSLYTLDVTDTSQVKVKFVAGSVGTSSWVQGNDTFITTSFVFTRLGDT